MKVQWRHFLIYSAILLLPFTSIPITSFFYRPITLLFLLPYYLFSIFWIFNTQRIPKDVVVINIFALYGIVLTTAVSGEFGFTRQLILFVFGTWLYTIFCIVNRQVSQKGLQRLIIWSMYIFILIGAVEMLSMFGLIPSIVKTFLSQVFSGESSRRIQITTSEASWAARIAFWYVPFSVLIMREKSKFGKIILMFLCSILLVSFSLTAYVMVIFATLLYFILFYDFKFLNLRRLGVMIILLGLIMFLLVLIYQANVGNGYEYKRVTSALNGNIMDLIYKSESLFIRIFYPICALEIFTIHPYGVGAGNFSLFLSKCSYMLDVPNYFNEVRGHLENGNATPRNFYLRVLCEIGLIGLLILMYFMFVVFQKVNRINSSEEATFYRLMFVISLSIQLQTDSYIFVLFWLGMSVIMARKDES